MSTDACAADTDGNIEEFLTKFAEKDIPLAERAEALQSKDMHAKAPKDRYAARWIIACGRVFGKRA